MRCKRCGEILNPGDTRCPVCSKTLSQPRTRPVPTKNPDNPVKLPQLDRFTRTYHKDASRSRLMQTVTIVAVAAAIVLLALVYTGLGDLNDALVQLQQDSQKLLQGQHTQQTPQVPDPVPEETGGTDTEPTDEPQALTLSGQNVEAALTLSRGSGGTYVTADMALGNFADRAKVWISAGEASPERQFKASWILEKSGDRLDAELIDRHSGAEGSYYISLNWNLAGTTFGSYANPMCIWEYRVDGGEWSSMTEELITAAPGGCEIRLSAEDLTGLLGEGAVMEIRCNLSMSHPDGGGVKLAVTGIALNAAGLTFTGALAE